MSDAPIEPQAFLHGTKVVDIGDLRVARGFSRRPRSSCQHKRLHYDSSERRIWCADCETNVEAFDAFEMLVDRHYAAYEHLRKRKEQVEEAEAFSLRSLAAKAIDQAWRRRSMVPACPHCHNGLFPEDFKNGRMTMLGRDFARARLASTKESRDD